MGGRHGRDFRLGEIEGQVWENGGGGVKSGCWAHLGGKQDDCAAPHRS